MVLQQIIHSGLRSALAFFLLLALTRFMGKKAISQITFFDFVVAITIGSVAASLALSSASSIYSATTSLIILALLAVFVDYIHLKSIKSSKLVESEPVVIIKNGQISEENMKKERLTLQDLTTLLREKNVFNLADVEFALIENDGKLSVLPKSQKQPLTPSDLNIPTSYRGLTKDLILDGNVMSENLSDANLNEEWLMNELKIQGISNVKEVFYAGLDTSGVLYVSKKVKNDSEKHGMYGIE